MKYKCLVLDHDNTVARTTPDIQYPAFKACLETIGITTDVTMEEFIQIEYRNVGEYLVERYGLNRQLLLSLKDAFYAYVRSHPSQFYDNIGEIIKQQVQLGGMICVVSKSPTSIILHDYSRNNCPTPDYIFGLEFDVDKQKPHPYILQHVIREQHLRTEELIVIDDKKSGLDMAEACGVKAAIAGWGLLSPNIIEETKKLSPNAEYLNDTKELERLLFD